MSGTRFARSGRCRFFVCLGVLVLMLCMVAIFHSSQQQLDETREQRMRCERQQEALNEQLQSMVEQKYELEKSCEQERNEQMETRRHLEQKLKELTVQRTNEQMDVQVRYDKLQQTHKQLQSEQNECQNNQKHIMEDANALEKRLQSMRSEWQQEKKVLNEEVTLWRDKYNILTHEKSRLELLLGTAGPKIELVKQIGALKDTVAAYEAHCAFRPVAQLADQPPPANASPQPPRAEKSFSKQVRVSPGLYRIDIKTTNKTHNATDAAVRGLAPTNKPRAKATHKPGAQTGGGGGDGGGGLLLPFTARHNRSLILNSVENFQILPKPIEKVASDDRDGGDGGAEVQLQQPANASPQPPRAEKSFSKQVRVSPGLYRIDIKTTNKTHNATDAAVRGLAPTNKPRAKATHKPGAQTGGGGGDGGGGLLLPFTARHNRSLILNSVENFQILPKPIEKVASDDRDGGDGGAEVQLQQPLNKPEALVAGKIVSPLSAPRKAAATEPTKSEQHVLEANAPMKPVNNSSTTSSTGLPPLPMPPNPRKLPENVAPIPENFEELLKNDQANRKVGDAKSEHDANAAEEVDQQKHEDANNNRYANVVNNMEHKGAAGVAANAAGNEDSGAHEIKDNDFMNDQNFNLPAEEDNNFFDGAGKAEVGGGAADDKPKDEDNDEDDGLAAVDAGDIAVKNHNHLLDTNNLNNEVAADQGKEFPDGLRLEEAAEEDEDEDDYSNPAARQQGGQAIRN